MKALRKTCLIVLSSIAIYGCGGGGGSDTVSSSPTIPIVSNPVIDTASANNAWDTAMVYLPFNPIPINMKDLGNYPPSPVAISLHGCDGVQELNRNSGDKYYPIFLAMRGYLVIEPDSYNSTFDKRFLCRTENGLLTWDFPPPVEYRGIDAVYAISRVKESSFWDKKTLLVQGQSQGFLITRYMPKEYTTGVTKWLLSGMPLSSVNCAMTGTTNYAFTNNAPTLIINSDFDQTPKECIERMPSLYPNVKLSLISGSFHVPIWSPEGYEIANQWVKLD